LYGPDIEYEFIGTPPKTCLGTDYVFLRSEICSRVTDKPPWREQPKRAIVMMGGSDTARLTPTVLQAFNGFDLRVDAIVGPGCTTEQEQKVRRVAKKCSADIHVARDPDDLVERMFQADFGVSTASSATYEHLALGTPIVSIPVVDNQEPIAAALRNRDAATVLRRDDDQHAFRTAIETYLTDADLRRRRRQLGQELVDDCGAERLFGEIISITEEYP
jgi:spore coat polysaccharide biosynthesis predicted glycosyltransferase SpsG